MSPRCAASTAPSVSSPLAYVDFFIIFSRDSCMIFWLACRLMYFFMGLLDFTSRLALFCARTHEPDRPVPFLSSAARSTLSSFDSFLALKHSFLALKHSHSHCIRRAFFFLQILCCQAREAAFRTIKTVAECLADELIAASAADSQKSYAIRKKDELERVAKTNR